MRYRILVRPIRATGRTAGHVPAFRPHATDRPAVQATPGQAGTRRLTPSGAPSRVTAGRVTAGRMAGGRVTGR